MLNILTHSENRNMNLSVIIPTLNNKEGLKYLLNYFKNTQYKVVVDNKKKNFGFAGGVNKGARM